MHSTLSQALSLHFRRPPHLVSLFAALLMALISSRTVNLTLLALELPGNAKIASKYRRLQRFFASFVWRGDEVGRLVLSLLPLERYTLLLDRTNWKWGRQNINFLTFAVLYQGKAIPLCWTLLEHGGCSDQATRSRLLTRLIALIPPGRITCVLADREFIGLEWFDDLRNKRIKRTIRIKENTRVGGMPARAYLGNLKHGQTRALYRKKMVFGSMMQMVATRSLAGELVILATDLDVRRALCEYAKRWAIETLYQNLKSRGFDFERTHLTQAYRLSTLFGLLSLAYLWALLVGEFKRCLEPLRQKPHGRLEQSVFRYGLDELAQTLKHARADWDWYVHLFLAPYRSTRLQL